MRVLIVLGRVYKVKEVCKALRRMFKVPGRLVKVAGISSIASTSLFNTMQASN